MLGFQQLNRFTQLGMAGGNPPSLVYKVTVTAGYAHTPKFTMLGGAPAAVVDWGDGTAQTSVVSGTELSHTYTNAGTYTVRLIQPNQTAWLQQIDINNDKVSSFILSMLKRFTALTYFNSYGGNNAVTGSLSDLPSGMTYFNCGIGSNAVTGSLSSLPAGMTALTCNAGNNAITGSLSDLPSGMTNLLCNGGNNSITGGTTACPARGLSSLDVNNQHATQATVDGILLRLWTDFPNRTVGGGTINVGSSNAAPSGTYQAATANPPTAGKEMAYELVNDTLNVSSNHWATVTFTA